jgi:SAM-dependent methyltransferase
MMWRSNRARGGRLDDLVAEIGKTVEQLHIRLGRLEEQLARREAADGRHEPGPDRQSAGQTKRIERLEASVDQLKRLAAAHLDPTEKTPYLDHLVELGALRPDAAILDVGCGLGRIAREVSRYLQPGGSYHGIEIQTRFIDHLRREFAERPAFHFHHADIRNTEYNPRGTIPATEYRFPVPDESVLLVVLRSVFTHMLPPEVDHYMGEIRRVLRPGGRSLITYYLLNEQSRPFVDSVQRPIFAAYPFDGRGSFPHDCGEYRVRYREVPERAVAYDEAFVRRLYVRHGMTILEPIRYGSWSGRTKYLTGQDVVVAEKAES